MIVCFFFFFKFRGRAWVKCIRSAFPSTMCIRTNYSGRCCVSGRSRCNSECTEKQNLCMADTEVIFQNTQTIRSSHIRTHTHSLIRLLNSHTHTHTSAHSTKHNTENHSLTLSSVCQRHWHSLEFRSEVSCTHNNTQIHVSSSQIHIFNMDIFSFRI